MRVVGAAKAFIGRLGFVLLDARCLAGFHEIDGFEHCIDAHREQAVEIDRAERVLIGDRRLLLDKNVAGVQAVVGPENRKSGFLLALDDRPVNGGRAAIGRQERGVILDRAVGRNVEKLFRNEQRDERHHLEVGLQRFELLPDFRLLVGIRLVDRKVGGERRFLERVSLLAFLFRRDIDADYIVTALQERFEYGFSEGLLAMHDDTHRLISPPISV